MDITIRIRFSYVTQEKQFNSGLNQIDLFHTTEKSKLAIPGLAYQLCDIRGWASSIFHLQHVVQSHDSRCLPELVIHVYLASSKTEMEKNSALPLRRIPGSDKNISLAFQWRDLNYIIIIDSKRGRWSPLARWLYDQLQMKVMKVPNSSTSTHSNAQIFQTCPLLQCMA